MPFRFQPLREESRRIAAKLSVDALALFVVSGVLYLLSEFVLPGIFSARVNFFAFFLVLGGLILLAAAAGRAGTDGPDTRVSRNGRVALAALATIFLFWGEKKLALPVLVGSAAVMFAVFLSFFTDILGKPRSDTR